MQLEVEVEVDELAEGAPERHSHHIQPHAERGVTAEVAAR
jgi:hypothetical protein